jgi:hypothetical protein
MKTSTKLLLVASALLLSGTSATFAQALRPNVNDPILFGGGSIGSNRNLNSALQNTAAYPWTRAERRAYRIWMVSQTNDPLKLDIRGRCLHCEEGEE